eukprot:scaffold14308_cov68-Phaeocystis_antarctica.AAC.9
MPTAPCQDLPGQAFLGSEQNEQSFARQLATSGLCQSFDDGRRFEGRFNDGLNKRLPCVALVLAARAHLDPSFLSDDVAAASYKSKAEYTSPAANYTSLVSRLARAAVVRAAEQKKVTTSLEGQRLLLWSQRRGSKEPESAGTVALVDALRRAGVQKAAAPPLRASSRAAQTQAAKVTKVVAAAAREGEQEGVAFLGGSFSLPDEIVAIVLSFSLAPLALCVAPLVAKAWLAVSHLPALHKTLRIPVRGHSLEQRASGLQAMLCMAPPLAADHAPLPRARTEQGIHLGGAHHAAPAKVLSRRGARLGQVGQARQDGSSLSHQGVPASARARSLVASSVERRLCLAPCRYSGARGALVLRGPRSVLRPGA